MCVKLSKLKYIFLRFLSLLGHFVLVKNSTRTKTLLPTNFSQKHLYCLSHCTQTSTLSYTLVLHLWGCPPPWLPNGPWALIWMATVLRRMSRANRESSSSGLRAGMSVTPAVKETSAYRSQMREGNGAPSQAGVISGDWQQIVPHKPFFFQPP